MNLLQVVQERTMQAEPASRLFKNGCWHDRRFLFGAHRGFAGLLMRQAEIVARQTPAPAFGQCGCGTGHINQSACLQRMLDRVH